MNYEDSQNLEGNNLNEDLNTVGLNQELSTYQNQIQNGYTNIYNNVINSTSPSLNDSSDEIF